MTTSLKDVASAQITGKLADMDCFAREYTVWGYGWLQDGRVSWCAGRDSQSLRSSHEARLLAGYAVTPLVHRSTRAVLSEENLPDGLYVLRLRLMKALRDDFRRAWFEALAELRAHPADDAALPLLNTWQDEIDGYLDEDDVALFAGAVGEMRLRGHIPVEAARELLAWVRKARAQDGGLFAPADQHGRTFCGCLMTSDGVSWRQLCNANEDVFWQQLEERLAGGGWHTPVFRKTLRFNRVNELPQVRKRFTEVYAAAAGERYRARMAELHELPCCIPADAWEKAFAAVERSCTAEALRGFLQMADRLHLRAVHSGM